MTSSNVDVLVMFHRQLRKTAVCCLVFGVRCKSYRLVQRTLIEPTHACSQGLLSHSGKLDGVGGDMLAGTVVPASCKFENCVASRLFLGRPCLYISLQGRAVVNYTGLEKAAECAGWKFPRYCGVQIRYSNPFSDSAEFPLSGCGLLTLPTLRAEFTGLRIQTR